MLKLTIGFSHNPRVEPLADGTVKPKGIDLRFTFINPGDLFYRNLKDEAFDVSEMSISGFSMTKERGDGSRWLWSGLPVFLSKAFLWLNLYVNTGAGIKDLGDFSGKRVGIPDYSMTAALWMRAVMKELYGIQPREIVWYNGRTPDFSHGGELGLNEAPPPGIQLHWLTKEQSLDVMLDRGELDAAFGVAPRSDRGPTETIDRHGGTAMEGNPRVHRLFKDFGRQLMTDYFRKTGVLPVNHMVFVKNNVLQKEPWAAMELLRAFQRSKEVAYERAGKAAGGYLLFWQDDLRRQSEAFGDDPYPVGLAANCKMLEILLRGSAEQGLTKGNVRPENLFYSTTWDT